MRTVALGLVLVGVALAGCKAELGSDPDSHLTVDGDTGGGDVDAPTSIDAPIDSALTAIDAPPDARLCDGGNAHAQVPGGGTCYFRIDMLQDHAGALALCVANSAQLAIVNTAAEQAAAVTLGTTADLWLGGTDALVEGTFLWPDATPMPLPPNGYWNAGEPNNGGTGGEDCSVFAFTNARAGTWDDRPCTGATGTYAVVCSFQP